MEDNKVSVKIRKTINQEEQKSIDNLTRKIIEQAVQKQKGDKSFSELSFRNENNNFTYYSHPIELPSVVPSTLGTPPNTVGTRATQTAV